MRWHDEPSAALGRRAMPGARWFPGGTLNYAEHALAARRRPRRRVAVVARSQTREPARADLGRARRRTWPGAAAGLRRLGVGRGDRVAAYLPNIPETLVAFLATAEPRRGLVVVRAGVRHPRGGRPLRADRAEGARSPSTATATASKVVDRRAEVAAIAAGAADAARTPCTSPYLGATRPPTTGATLAAPSRGAARRSSRCRSTTRSTCCTPRAPPGCRSRSCTATAASLLEHLKVLALHHDLGPGDRFFWFTTTGWMMWNYLVSGPARRRDDRAVRRRPGAPRPRHAVATRRRRPASTYFGVGAPFLMACRKAGVVPADRDLRCAASARPARRCRAEGFRWVYDAVGAARADRVGQRRHRRVHRVRRRRRRCCRCAPARSPAGCSACAVEAFDPDGRPCPPGVTGRAGDHRADAVDAGRLLGRPRRQRYRARVLRRLPGRVAPRRLDHDHRRRRVRDHRPLRRHAEPRRRAARHQRVLRGGRGARPRSPTASSCTSSDDPTSGPGELLLFVALAPGADARRRPARGASRAALRTELSPRHVPDEIERGPGGAAHAVGQEARGAGEAHPRRRRRRRGGQPRARSPTRPRSTGSRSTPASTVETVGRPATA